MVVNEKFGFVYEFPDKEKFISQYSMEIDSYLTKRLNNFFVEFIFQKAEVTVVSSKGYVSLTHFIILQKLTKIIGQTSTYSM